MQDQEKEILYKNSIENPQRIFKDRKRTNILKSAEQSAINYLVKRIPDFITSNTLTAIGVIGSFIVLAGFLLATYSSKNYLLLGVLGLAINWFGDSLDGRIAYYRNTPRKWFGFALDIIVDWLGMVLIGLGYLVYAKELYELIAFIFVALYGWAMIISQLRYKITDKYAIDAGVVGPTELRVLIAAILIVEVIANGTIRYFGEILCVVLFFINIADTVKLLKMGDVRDRAENVKS